MCRVRLPPFWQSADFLDHGRKCLGSHWREAYLEGNLNSQVNLSDPPRSRITGTKSRHVATLSNVPLLGRTALASRIQQVATQSAPPGAKYPNLIAFLQFSEMGDPISSRLHSQERAIPDLSLWQVWNLSPHHSCAGGPLSIAVAADWGTGTLESETVAEI